MAVTEIVGAIEKLTVLELAELVKTLEDRFGVTAAAPAAAAAAPAAAAEVAPVEEQTEFSVVLTGFGDKKIQVIKVVRALTGLGLKEAKDVVEGVPSVVKDGLSKEDAEKWKAQLVESGATIEIK